MAEPGGATIGKDSIVARRQPLRQARSRFTQFAFPDAIKSAPLDPPVPWGEFTDASDYRRKFPDGRIGSNPALATPEAGRRLYDAAVAALTRDYLGWVAA